MDGLQLIMNSIKDMMEELFDECTENKGILRSIADHLGVTDTNAIVDVVLEKRLIPFSTLWSQWQRILRIRMRDV